MGSTYLSGLTPSTIFRSLLEQMEGIFFFKRNHFWAPLHVWTGRKNLTYAKAGDSDQTQANLNFITLQIESKANTAKNRKSFFAQGTGTLRS